MDRQVCPRCKSIDIGIDNSDFKSMGLGGATIYRCNNCGLSSPTFPIMNEDDVQNFIEETKKFDEESVDITSKEKTHYKKYLFVGILILILPYISDLGIVIIIATILLYLWKEVLKK